MAYADQGMSTRKAVSIGIVILLHLAIGYAFITGLAYNVVKKVATDLKVVDVTEQPPPPEEKPPPPPPEKQEVQPPPIVAPPPLVQTNQTPTFVAPPPPPVVAPAPPTITPPAPPAPPRQAAVNLTPKGNFQSLMSTDDYPPSSIRNEEEGTVAYRLDVGADGRVTKCTVTSSSGHPALDNTACTLLQRRARFNPGKDPSGGATGGVYNGRFTWKLPRD